MQNALSRLLAPKSVAVVGANDKTGYPGRFMKNLIDQRYPGVIYPINPSRSEVFGIKCYPSLKEVPGDIDLAAVIIKSDFVLDMLQQCAVKKVGSILIVTSGFSEVDPVRGREVETKIRRIARDNGIRVLGPNTTGYANTEENFWGCTMSTLGENPLCSGRAALISQSGSAAFGPLMSAAKDRGVGLKYILTTGNEADLGLLELADILLDEDDIDVVAAMIEGIKDAAAFLRIAQKARNLSKTLVVMKMGESSVGSRAAASHTAAMTGDMAIFNAIAKQYGILKAEEYTDLMEMVKIVQTGKKLNGKRFCVLSHSGGIAGFAGDTLGKYGFEVPVLPKETQDYINGQYLKGFASAQNPLDLTTWLRSEALLDIVQHVDTGTEIDGYIFMTNGNREQLKYPIESMKWISKTKLCCLLWAGPVAASGLDAVREAGIPLSFSVGQLTRTLSQYYESCQVSRDEPLPRETTDLLAAVSTGDRQGGYKNEVFCKDILDRIGVKTPSRRLLSSRCDAERLADGRRYVMKIVSDTVIHKSDMGGVITGLITAGQLGEAYDRLEALRHASRETIQGIMVEDMASEGLDLVVGLRRDEMYGWVLMAGLGGIMTELFHMTSIRLIPLCRAELERMLNEVPGLSQLLAGYRGQPALDRQALLDTVERLIALVIKNSEMLSLIEVNPLRVMPEGAVALDCVISFK